MKICLDNKIGSILATDNSLEDKRFLRCNGNVINNTNYPEYFKAIGINNSMVSLPNLTETESKLGAQVKFYIRCLL